MYNKPKNNRESGQSIVELAIAISFISLFVMLPFYMIGFADVGVKKLIESRINAEDNALNQNGTTALAAGEVFDEGLATVESLSSAGGVDISDYTSRMVVVRGEGETSTDYDNAVDLPESIIKSFSFTNYKPVSQMVDSDEGLNQGLTNDIYFPILQNTN